MPPVKSNEIRRPKIAFNSVISSLQRHWTCWYSRSLNSILMVSSLSREFNKYIRLVFRAAPQRLLQTCQVCKLSSKERFFLQCKLHYHDDKNFKLLLAYMWFFEFYHSCRSTSKRVINEIFWYEWNIDILLEYVMHLLLNLLLKYKCMINDIVESRYRYLFCTNMLSTFSTWVALNASNQIC